MKQEEHKLTAQQVLAYQLKQAGYTDNEICDKLGVSRATVWRYNKAVETEIEADPIIKAARDDMVTLIPQSVRVYHDIVHDPTSRDKADIATKVLSTHNIVSTKTEVDHNVPQLKQFVSMYNRARELAGLAGTAESTQVETDATVNDTGPLGGVGGDPDEETDSI